MALTEYKVFYLKPGGKSTTSTDAEMVAGVGSRLAKPLAIIMHTQGKQGSSNELPHINGNLILVT